MFDIESDWYFVLFRFELNLDGLRIFLHLMRDFGWEKTQISSKYTKEWKGIGRCYCKYRRISNLSRNNDYVYLYFRMFQSKFCLWCWNLSIMVFYYTFFLSGDGRPSLLCFYLHNSSKRRQKAWQTMTKNLRVFQSRVDNCKFSISKLKMSTTTC